MRIRNVLCGRLVVLLAASGLLPGVRPVICEEDDRPVSRVAMTRNEMNQIA